MMTPEERAQKVVRDWNRGGGSSPPMRMLIETAIREAEADLLAEIDRLRADLEEARANARHYANLALEFEHKEWKP